MSDTDIVALAGRIRELETQFIRTPAGLARGDTNCTNCDTNCTNCAGDRFQAVLLPGEFERISGGELVKKLQAARR
jgi:hypothetical protein